MKAPFRKYSAGKLAYIIIGVSVLLYIFTEWIIPDIIGVWEMKSLDSRYKVRNYLNAGPKDIGLVVQVNVDDYAYEKTQKNFLPRSFYGNLVKILTGAGAKTIGVDIFFSGETYQDEDSTLIYSIGEAGNCVLPVIFRLNDDKRFNYDSYQSRYGLPELDRLPDIPVKNDKSFKAYALGAIPLSGLWEKSKSLAHANFSTDADGSIRKYPLYVNVAGKAFPSMVLGMLCDFLDYPVDKLEIISGKQVILRNVKLPLENSARDLSIPIDKKGRIIVNYAGTWMDGLESVYSAGDIVEYTDDPQSLRPEFKDKLVVLAEVSTRSGDLGTTPLEANFPKSAVYSHILNALLQKKFITKLPSAFDILIYLIFIGVILWLCHYTKLTSFSIFFVVFTVIYIAFAYVSFIYMGIILPVIGISAPAVFVFLSAAVFKFHYQEKHRLILENSFKCYLPPDLLKKIEDDPNFLKLGGEKRDVVIFFSDIRKFSRIAEDLEPHDLVKLMNRYFSNMVDIVFKYDGTVDKFAGDEMMVIFGAPFAHDDDPIRAIKMALEMQTELIKFNETLVTENHLPIKIGIGINCGNVVAGNIGSERRMDYSVVGDVINKAARIVSKAGPGEIMIGEALYNKVKDFVEVEKMESFIGKPGEAPVQSYLLRSLKV